MAEKIQKGIPWFLIAIIFLTTAVLLFEKINGVAAQSTMQMLVDVSSSNAAPTVSNVNITASPIVLTENATTAVNCVSSTTDTNGWNNISTVTAAIFRSGAGANCAANDNNCYWVSSTARNCDFGATDTNSRNATCTAYVWFHADPTDAGAYSAEAWWCSIKAIDAANASGTATDTTPSELNTQNALIIDDHINYGKLDPNSSNTATSTKATTTGNAEIDLNLYGVNMDGEGGAVGQIIAVGSQEYSSTTFTHSDGGGTDLLVSTGANYNFNLTKPTAHPSDSADDIYWSILIDNSQVPGDYSGTNTISAIAPL